MRHFGVWRAGLAGLLFLGAPVWAQTSLDVLSKELDELKQEHQEANSATFSRFINALDNASASPQAALALYQQAGGAMPTPTPVKTRYEHETPTEKEARLAKDASVAASFSSMVQMHCGMMREAAMFVAKPDAPTLKDEWTAWLKEAAATYPQLGGAGTPLWEMTMQDSPVGKFLGFRGWGDKEQGQWSLKDVPKMYKSAVLDPLRAQPSAATLAAWDTYIAMENADEPDAEKWNRVQYPDLQFERDSDDFAIEPSVDKITKLVALMTANPTHPHFEQWLGRVHDMMASLRTTKSGAPGPMTNFVQPDAPVAGK